MRRNESRSCTSVASAGTVTVATLGCAAAKRRRSVRSRLTRPSRSACSWSRPAVSGSLSVSRSAPASALCVEMPVGARPP